MRTDRVSSGGWLADEPVVERLDLGEGSWVDVMRGMVPPSQADEVHDDLLTSVRWEQGKVFRYERWIEDPRLSGWQGNDVMHPALADVQRWITARYRVGYDGVALAHYRDGRDSVAFHRDRELRWLDDTVIGVLSLGATRHFLLKPLGASRYDREDLTGVLDLRPASGDLLVMGGRCQAAWLHAVPKMPARCRSRISAQWRWTSRRGRRDTNPSYYAPRHFTR